MGYRTLLGIGKRSI